MRARRLAYVLGPALLVAACADQPARGTLAQLHDVAPDVEEVTVEQGLETAMQSYRRYLEETPRTEMTPEAMRRLADLQIEKQFGIRGDGEIKEMAAPEEADAAVASTATPAATGVGSLTESDRDFEARATQVQAIAQAGEDAAAPIPPGAAGEAAPAGPLEAIALYDRLLAEYPDYEHNDRVRLPEGACVRRARAHGRGHGDDGALRDGVPALVALRRGAVQARRVLLHPPQVPRRGERVPARSSAWATPRRTTSWRSTSSAGRSTSRSSTRKRSTGSWRCSITRSRSATTSTQAHDEDEERRIADTFRVISLGFSNLGGPEVVQEYFAANGRPQLRGQDLRQPRRVLPREAPLRRRGEDLQGVRRAQSVPPCVAALRHAGGGDLRQGQLPEAGARGEEGVRVEVRRCRPSTGVTSTSTSRRRC